MHKPKPLRANLSKELHRLIMQILAKNRPTSREIADMLPLQDRGAAADAALAAAACGTLRGNGGSAQARCVPVQLKNVDSTICAQHDTQARAPPAPRWTCCAVHCSACGRRDGPWQEKVERLSSDGKALLWAERMRTQSLEEELAKIQVRRPRPRPAACVCG